jgi:hypothetical protein
MELHIRLDRRRLLTHLQSLAVGGGASGSAAWRLELNLDFMWITQAQVRS